MNWNLNQAVLWPIGDQNVLQFYLLRFSVQLLAGAVKIFLLVVWTRGGDVFGNILELGTLVNGYQGRVVQVIVRVRCKKATPLIFE